MCCTARLSSVTGENSGIAAPMADVKPGETFTITGECVTRVHSAENLRVVLTLADTDTAMPGYRSVLATEQEIGAGGLSMSACPICRKPPTAFSQVKVFRLGQGDAGNLRCGHDPHRRRDPRKLG